MEQQQRLLRILLVSFVLQKKLFAINTNNTAYFQLSRLNNQLGGTVSQAVKYNSNDGSNEIVLVNNDTYRFGSAGIYYGVFSAQIGSPSRNGRGEVHVWIRRGTQDKPNSNSIQTVSRGATSVLVYQTAFQALVGHEAVLIFSAFAANECSALGLIATAPVNEPVVPSIIASAIQLSDLINPILHSELTSSKTQLGHSTAQAITLNYVTGNNAIDNTTLAIDGAIRYMESGLYFAIACAQVGSAIDTRATGEVHLWLRLNGKDLPNSNTIQTISNGSTAVLISQTIFRPKVNDKLTLMFSTTNRRLGLIASTPQNEPAAPSMIFTTFQLGNNQNSVPYAQLSSSQTQWGCLTPKTVRLANNDGLQNVKNDHGILEFNEPGTYLVIAAGQVGSRRGRGIGDVHIWIRFNGQDLANSNTIQTVYHDTAVLFCQAILVIKAGDRVQVMFSTDVTEGILGLVASKPHGEPEVPSMIFSAFKSGYSG